MRNTGHRHGHTSGFTLVEMLTVIIIVGLLLAIGTPTVLRMQLQSIRMASLSTLQTISSAINNYKDELGVYPPSEQDGAAYGRHRLVWALVGYRSAAEDKLDGPGFKISTIGKQYGPYGGTEKIDMIGDPATDTMSFVDGFRQEVFYYCGWKWTDHDGDPATPDVYEFDKVNGYKAADNADKGPANLVNHAKTVGPPRKWYRKDFLLMTKGPDGVWKPITTDDATTDDITNFLSEN